jgi:hypothetical protein
MQAKAVDNFINLTAVYEFEGVQWAETYCNDYFDFKALPKAIEVNGRILGKVAWNSDKGYAAYNSRSLLGKII